MYAPKPAQLAIRQTNQLHHRQLDILETLSRGVPMSIREIADDLGCSYVAVHASLRRCVTNGLVEIQTAQRRLRQHGSLPVIWTITAFGREELQLRIAAGSSPGVASKDRKRKVMPAVYLMPRLRRVLRYLASAQLRSDELAGLLDRTVEAVRCDLKRLRRAALVSRTGYRWSPTPAGYAAIERTTR